MPNSLICKESNAATTWNSPSLRVVDHNKWKEPHNHAEDTHETASEKALDITNLSFQHIRPSYFGNQCRRDVAERDDAFWR